MKHLNERGKKVSLHLLHARFINEVIKVKTNPLQVRVASEPRLCTEIAYID